MSTSTLEGLSSSAKLGSGQVFKMICLPPVAHHNGTCLLVPQGNSVVQAMCESLGGCVECETEATLRALMVSTCLMGPFYNILKTQRNWLSEQGVPAADASYFLGRTYLGLAQDAASKCTDPSHFDCLVDENTPGGLNEQAIANLTRMGVYSAYCAAQDAILERLAGDGDGEIGSKVAEEEAEASLLSFSTEALEAELKRRSSL